MRRSGGRRPGVLIRTRSCADNQVSPSETRREDGIRRPSMTSLPPRVHLPAPARYGGKLVFISVDNFADEA